MIPDRLRWLVEPGSAPVELGERFGAAGKELFLVGGSVRDAFLGRQSSDLDFTTDARPEQIKSLISGWADAVYTMGEAFGTIGARKGNTDYEITTFRAEVYREDSRKPHVDYSDRVEDDLERRDFTVNAMALSIPDAVLIDPHGGVADLAQRELRTPMDPHVSFSDDPLRMLRLFRFQATLGFNPDDAARLAVHEMADRLDIVSAERIRDEFSKLIVADDPGPALWGLVRAGLADSFLPELSRLEMEIDPHHRHKDVLAHTIAVTQKAARDHPVEERLRLRLAALLHDVGKPDTRRFVKSGVTFHHHEVVGARIARDRLRALRYSKEIVDQVSELVYLHLRPHTLKMGWTDSAVRRYVRDAGDVLEDLNELVRCDVTTANQKRANAIQRRIDELEVRIEELNQQEELAKLRAPINGNDVMELLGVGPGPHIGEIMNILLEKRIDDGPYSEDEAFEVVKEWAAGRGL